MKPSHSIFESFLRYATIILAPIALMLALDSIHNQIPKLSQSFDKDVKTIDSLNKELLLLQSDQKKLKSSLSHFLQSSQQIQNPDQVMVALAGLRTQVDQINEQTIGLRQALNPMKPEEVLTIARLTDIISNLNSRIDQVEKEMDEKHRIFRESVIRELEASNKATTWLFVVIIPLVLNLLYSIWKDRREYKHLKSVDADKQEINFHPPLVLKE